MMLFVWLFSLVITVRCEVPVPKIEILNPKGFRLSFPDDDGILFIEFHGKLNRQIHVWEDGTFSSNLTKLVDGRWTFTDTTTELKYDDVLYYWMKFEYLIGGKTKIQFKTDQRFYFKDLSTMSRQPTENTTPTILTTTRRKLPEMKRKTNFGEKVMFEENFNSDIRSSQYWTIEQRFADAPDYEFVMYMDKPETLQVTDGILKIKPIQSETLFSTNFVKSRTGYDFKDICTATPETRACKRRYESGFILPPVVSSRISTKNKFTLRNGTIEIRAKLPQGDWVYPEIYLNPIHETYGPHYDSGQVTIAFTSGNIGSNNVLRGGLVFGDNQICREYAISSIQRSNPWTEDFHTYTVIWKPDMITFSVDGIIYNTVEPPEDEGFASWAPFLQTNTDKWRSGSKMAPFDQEMYITLGVGVGGLVYNETFDNTKPWKNRERLSELKFYEDRGRWSKSWDENTVLEVDYIKVTAL